MWVQRTKIKMFQNYILLHVYVVTSGSIYTKLIKIWPFYDAFLFHVEYKRSLPQDISECFTANVVAFVLDVYIAKTMNSVFSHCGVCDY